MSPDRIQPWRWRVKAVLAALALGVPFLRINGQSALRFDIPTLKLHFFGTTVWMDQFFLVLIVILILSFLAVFLTMLFGRIWCGWMCPQAVVVELTGFIDRLSHRQVAARFPGAAALLLISVVLAADIIWYFVEPHHFFRELVSGHLGYAERWSWAVLSLITFLNFLFLRRTFCATVCPYAKLQGALFDERTLVIAADTDRMELCKHCDACVAACPVGIDVRKGLHSECVSCAMCIDACAGRMKNRGLPSLIRYRFGTIPQSGGLLRGSVVLAGGVTAIFIVLLIVLLLTSVPIEMDISADPASPPVRREERQVTNTYILLLTNRTDTQQELSISAQGTAGPVQVSPETVAIRKGDHLRVTVTLRAEGDSRLRGESEPVIVRAVSRTIPDLRLERKTVMLQPW